MQKGNRTRERSPQNEDTEEDDPDEAKTTGSPMTGCQGSPCPHKETAQESKYRGTGSRENAGYLKSPALPAACTDRTGSSQREITSGRPVVAYVRVQSSKSAPEKGIMKKSEDSIVTGMTDISGYGEINKQSTLKIRGDSGDSYSPMPDLVKSRHIAQPTKPSLVRRSDDMYTPPPNQPPDYNSLGQLSGVQIAEILSNRNKESPKFTHSTDRPQVTFGNLRERNYEHVELDSIGSTRSGESSRSSEARVQDSVGEGQRCETEKRMGALVFSDSDSSNPMSTGKPKEISGYNVFPEKTERHKTFAAPANQTYHSLDSGQGYKVVDEAYGTMGSNGFQNMHGADPTGHGSTGLESKPAMRRGVLETSIDASEGPRQRTSVSPGGGGGRGLPHSYLHTSVLCCLSLICLGVGVYCQVISETEAHIKIYAPPEFYKRQPEVYASRNEPLIVSTRFQKQALEIVRYDMEDAWIRNLQDNRCQASNCEQGCDVNSGKCICRHGYYLVDAQFCVDINECDPIESGPEGNGLGKPCHKHAECINSPGSYRCACKQGYYGDGKLCEDCNSHCRNGTFEAMPCSNTQPKLCRECTKKCKEGYYISAPCGRKQDTQCKRCTDRCMRGFYEFTPCHGHQRRQCKDMEKLPKPSFSKNTICEDMKRVKQVQTGFHNQEPNVGPLTTVIKIKRGSSFSVFISLKDSNLAPLLKAVDHSDSNDNSGFFGSKRITEYCPFPVPEKYQLSLVMHQGVTTKAKYYSCKGKKDSCDGETGYYLDPKETCETYSAFGRLPTLNPDNWGVVCNRPGKLSELFGVSSELNDLSTMFVDKTVKCAEQRTYCTECTRKCARNMQSYRGSHPCNITGESSDNGESPRLQYCHSCCSKKECSKLCQVYHNSECPLERCVTGNLAEFVLSPIYFPGNNMACHIEPVPKYVIYDANYTILYNNQVINDVQFRAKKIFSGTHPDRAVDKHNFLTIYYGSEVKGQPDLVEGDISLKSFGVGYYQAKGRELSKTRVSARSFTIRPKTPFGISTKSWARQGCNTDLLSELILTTSNPPNSVPYRPDPELKIYRSRDHQKYHVFNRTDGHWPYISFEIKGDQSLLKYAFNDTTVLDDHTLHGQLLRAKARWALKIKGQLQKCPGYFNIRVMEFPSAGVPLYPPDPLYHYDVGVKCPNDFSINFYIPTHGPDNYDKRLMVEITDTFRTIKMSVFRQAPNDTGETEDHTIGLENKGEKEMTIFTPIIAVLCVVISFLLLLLFVGFITEPGRKIKKSDNKVHSQHLLFVVCYVTFRAAYSITVTFTVLALMIKYVNRDPMGTLVEFPRYSETAENNQKIQMETIHSYVVGELKRQNDIAMETKLTCEQKLISLQDTLEKKKQEMKNSQREDRIVSKVILEYTEQMIENLTANVKKFKDDFSVYARKALDRLTRSIVQTSSALQSNKWLNGAKIVYDTVKAKRSSQGRSTKPFIEWVGIKQEVERLSVDLSLKTFPMPNLTEFIDIDIPKSSGQLPKIPEISEISLPKNQWYYQYEKKPATPTPPDPAKSKKFKLATNDLMSWSSFLAALVVVDLVWFVHRMARTYSTAKMILYGCPTYIDCKRIMGSTPAQRKSKTKHSVSSRCFNFFKDLNIRVMKTEFVPKVVATATVCCAIYVILGVADKLMTVRTLASVGYIESLVAPVETMHRLARTRVRANAHRINRFEYPFYEELINVRTKRYQLMLDMYAGLQTTTNILHDSEFCAWQKMLHPDQLCNCTTAYAPRLSFEGCELPPVTPYSYQKRDFGVYRDELMRSIVPYINATRQLVIDTCHLVLIFVAVLVLADALGSVTWIYLKRFNLLRLKPMFEIEHYPAPEVNHT